MASRGDVVALLDGCLDLGMHDHEQDQPPPRDLLGMCGELEADGQAVLPHEVALAGERSRRQEALPLALKDRVLGVREQILHGPAHQFVARVTE
jgi:hypothetical protein